MYDIDAITLDGIGSTETISSERVKVSSKFVFGYKAERKVRFFSVATMFNFLIPSAR